LPRRFVVTYRSLPSRPNLVADLSDWNFSILAPDSLFEFAASRRDPGRSAADTVGGTEIGERLLMKRIAFVLLSFVLVSVLATDASAFRGGGRDGGGGAGAIRGQAAVQFAARWAAAWRGGRPAGSRPPFRITIRRLTIRPLADPTYSPNCPYPYKISRIPRNGARGVMRDSLGTFLRAAGLGGSDRYPGFPQPLALEIMRQG
jgi:hypothetical protein